MNGWMDERASEWVAVKPTTASPGSKNTIKLQNTPITTFPSRSYCATHQRNFSSGKRYTHARELNQKRWDSIKRDVRSKETFDQKSTSFEDPRHHIAPPLLAQICFEERSVGRLVGRSVDQKQVIIKSNQIKSKQIKSNQIKSNPTHTHNTNPKNPTQMPH